MNSLHPSWDRLTAAARLAAAGEVVPAVSGAWVTRVAALGLAEQSRYPTAATWLAWTMPGFGVAVLVATLAVVAWGSLMVQPTGSAELVALADPLAGNSLLP